MAGELLLDPGALVSLLDRSQHRHAVFTDFFETWSGEVVTTEAVITEAFHLLARVRGGPKRAWTSFCQVAPFSFPRAVRRYAELVL